MRGLCQLADATFQDPGDGKMKRVLAKSLA